MTDAPSHTSPPSRFQRSYVFFLYAVYLGAGLLTLVPSLTFPASIAMLMAIFLTWAGKRTRHSVLVSHYLWLRRTFWIGMGVYLSVITLAIVMIAMPSVDTDALMNGMADGSVATPEQINDLLLSQQPRGNLVLMVVLGGLFAVWWSWRCGHGLWRLWLNQPISRPESWA